MWCPRRTTTTAAVAALSVALWGSAPAGADPGLPGTGAGGGGFNINPDINVNAGASLLFMCPGVGGAANVLGFGGGYCDFNFAPIQLSADTFGVSHVHCEWGGGAPVVEMWNCWRVFPGQPDHPAHPDPDVIPDGWGVPWAINGPSVTDQWPPPGLFVAAPDQPPPPPGPGLPIPDFSNPPKPAPAPPKAPPRVGTPKVPLKIPGT